MIEQLQHASVGRPITKNGIALHPVYLHGSSATTVGFGHVIVEELGSASVPTLRATNPAAHPSVILEGELVFGGLQDRIINSTIIVPANSSIEVPVSCVEQGRWSNEGSFSRSGRRATRRVRRSQIAGGLRTGGRTSDQGAVWESVRHELERFRVSSQSGSLAAVTHRIDTTNPMASSGEDRVLRAIREVTAMGPLPGQRGVVVTHGRRVVSAEVLSSTEHLASVWAGIVESALVEAVDPTIRKGSPSSTSVLRFLKKLAEGDGTRSPGIGLGVEYTVETRGVIGRSIVLDDMLVHASAFALAA